MMLILLRDIKISHCFLPYQIPSSLEARRIKAVSMENKDALILMSVLRMIENIYPFLLSHPIAIETLIILKS
jgi:hypothetical protein